MQVSVAAKSTVFGRIADIVNGQSLNRKLVAVACASLLPVLVLGTVLVRDKMDDLTFTRKEMTGVSHLEKAWPVLLEHVYSDEKDHATAGHLHNEAATKDFLEFAQAEAAALETGRTAELVKNTIENDPELVIPAGLQHLSAIANNSNLILDPEIASIYLVLAASIELPKTLEGLSNLEQAFDKVTDSTTTATPNKSEIIVAKYKVAQAVDAVIDQIETSIRATTNESIQKSLEADLKAFKTSSEELQTIITQAGGAEVNYMLLAKSADKASAAIEKLAQSSDALWKTASASLRTVLQERETGLWKALYTSIAAFAALVLIAGFGLYLIGRSISQPISQLIGHMWQLRDGATSFQTPFTVMNNEIGDIARAVEASRLNSSELQKARGDIDVRLDEESARNADTRSFLTEIGSVVSAAADGKLDKRLLLTGRSGFLFELSGSINTLLESVQSGIVGTSTVVKALANGDLSGRMEGNHKGIFLDLMRDVNALSEKFSAIAGQIGNATGSVQGATREIGAGVTDLSVRTEQQASSLEETAASMEEIAATVRQNADNAQEANQLASAARQLAVTGGDIAKRAIGAMDKIESSSRLVSDIVGMIQEIAFQTNILALNAAVEAARAGEAGRGFAVVANEVRALAQRSAQASKDIKELIAGTTDNVTEGVDLVKRAGTSLTEIVTSVRKVADIVSEIAAASQEQSSGIDQVSRAITNMDEMTQQNASLVEETNAALHSAQQQVEELQQAVSFFRVADQTKYTPRHVTAKSVDVPATRESEPAKAPENQNLQDKLRQLAMKMLNAQQPKAAVVKSAFKPAVNADWKEF